MSPLRFITPAQLVICLVLFFLPWIELSCTLPPEARQNQDKEEIEAFKKETGIDPTRPIGMVTQSGLQIATGDSSLASDFKKLEEKMNKAGVGGGGGFKMQKDPTKEKKDTAPLLFLYPVALIGGIVFALLPWASPARRFLALGCCIVAFGVVGLQAAIGFPLDKDLKKQNEEMKKMGGMFGPGDFDQPKGGATPLDMFKVRWKIPLYLSLLLVLGAAATSVLGDTPARRPKKKRRYRDEDDEDWEEDRDDDRPRRRRDRDEDRVPDDEDEPDERPRRRRRDDDD